MKLNGTLSVGYIAPQSALLICSESQTIPTTCVLGATRDCSYRFISRHLTLWLVLLILGAAFILSPVLVGARSEGRRSDTGSDTQSATGGVQKQSAKAMVGVLNEASSTKRAASRSFNVDDSNRREIEAKLFLNPSTPSMRTTQPATSFNAKPKEGRLIRAHSFHGDLRDLLYRESGRAESARAQGTSGHHKLVFERICYDCDDQTWRCKRTNRARIDRTCTKRTRTFDDSEF